jgi:hypothetical protein
MAVMMQAFYWDCAIKEKKKGEWWNFLAAEAPKLGKQGRALVRSGYPPFQRLPTPIRMATTRMTISISVTWTKKAQ